MSRPGAEPPQLGVVIPALNEADFLPLLLDDLCRLPFPHEVVVADGGSRDRTRELALEGGARVLASPRGRALQMNAGAADLDTPWLLFLHADSRLPPETLQALARWLGDRGEAGAAHFAFRLDARGVWWTLLEAGQRVRERISGLAYGDQGLLISRTRFEALGGFPELPLMEDVAMMRRLRQSGGVQRIEAPVVTSARRYREEGWLLGWLRNAGLLLLHSLGVSPHRLARWYRPRGGEAEGAEEGPDTLLIFAKLPRRGRVKTRLAAGVGEIRATEIYRRMAREAVDRLYTGPWRTIVCFDPPGAEGGMRDWLDLPGLTFRPQSQGDLGDRLTHAFREAFQEGGPVCVVGTDIPELDADAVERTFQLLREEGGPDLVLGPARDGGYYLLGAKRPAPELFREIPWSTDLVLERTRRRARESGLAVAELPTLNDVDEVEDLPAAWRAAL